MTVTGVGQRAQRERDLALVRTLARLAPVPLVPEIRLHLATEPIGPWQATEEVLGRTGLPPPYWAFAWAGGQALARYLLDHPAGVAGRRVLDLASGSGLVAIAAAKAGAASVTACDVDPLAAAAIGINAAANRAAVTVVLGDVLDRDGPPGQPPAGLILVADAFYQRELASRVMGFCERARARGARVLAADWGRAHLPRDRFTAVASYEVPDLGALEDTDTKCTTVWEPAW